MSVGNHTEIDLRPYQRECIKAVWSAWPKLGDSSLGIQDVPGILRPAVVMPTGSGKTVMFSALIRDFIRVYRERALVLVHRDELADQAIAKIRATAPDLHVGKVKAAINEADAQVVVASVQTLSRDARLDYLVRYQEVYGNFGLVITDECHHSSAASYQKIYSAFPGIRQAGFTATLARGDGVGLGDVWDDVVYSRSVLHMIADGFLVDVRGKALEMEDLDLGTVKRSGGDFQAKALGEALMEVDGPAVIARAMREHAADRRSIVFTPTVEMAHATAEALSAVGLSAGVVSGATPREERQQTYAGFAAGKLRALVNCMVLTEGFDMPQADCVVIARPTQSAPLFVQMVGRVLRPFPDKTDALVLDITGTGGRLSTLIDLAPTEVRDIREGESLAEAAVRTEEEGNRRVPAGSLAFSLKHRQLDLFAATGMNWLRTDAGVMFIQVAGGYILLWPSTATPGNWDVRVAPAQGRKFPCLHADLPIGTAMAWAETEADVTREASDGDLSTTKARWRREPAAPAQLAKARGLGLEPVPGARKGDVADLITIRLASMKFDRYVGVIA